jgi:hypothetical protein
LKNHLITVWTTLFSQTSREVEKINRKTLALTLLTITAFAAIVGELMVTAQATETDSTATDTKTTATADQSSGMAVLQYWDVGGDMTREQGFGGGPRGHGDGGGFMGGVGNIEVSSEYTANVNAILTVDTDMQNLVSEGYNVTSIHPIVRNIVEADGTIATKATTATIMLQNGTSGFATVSVDVENAKVTQIVIITRTVIDKTSS